MICVAKCSAADEEPRVTARLLCGAESIAAGDRHTVGVHIEIEEGWHVYWRNPGGAGMATSFDLESDQIESVGELEWPVPIGFDQGGGIPGYGYEDEVVLTREVSVTSPGEISVTADVAWLACKSVCVLGEALLRETLPLSADRRAESKKLQQLWNGRQPQVADPVPGITSLKTTGSWDAEGRGGTFSTWLSWSERPDVIEWFPAPGDALKITDVKIRSRANLTRVDFSLRRIGSKTATSLESVLVVGSADERKGFELAIDLN